MNALALEQGRESQIMLWGASRPGQGRRATIFDREISMYQLRLASFVALVFVAASLWGPQATAQDINAVFGGYATTGYEARNLDNVHHDFSASFTPVGLVKMGEDFLFEGEVDVGLHDRGTTTTLEHAQIHYLGWNRIQVTAGKFHLPFGLWMHPSWINKMPDPPLLYGHAHGGVAERALFPILFDVGAKVMGKVPLGDQWGLGVEAWISQGPAKTSESGGHHHDNGHEASHESSTVPPIRYGTNYSDTNANKMVGGRLRVMSPRTFMIGLGGFHARYDPDGHLGLTGTNLSLKWQPGRFDFRVEAVLLRQEFVHHSAVDVAQREGYYIQITRRMGMYEPVVRWSQLPSAHAGGHHIQSQRRELALGLIHWFTPSIPLKASYQWRLDGADGVRVQWAFGF